VWRSGSTRRRRHTALAQMVELASLRGDHTTPWHATPQLWDFFRDEADVLRQLQHDWRVALAGAVYVAIDSGQGDLQHDVLTAFSRTKARYAGARAILEANEDHPAISAAMRKERALLAGFAAVFATSAPGVESSLLPR